MSRPDGSGHCGPTAEHVAVLTRNRIYTVRMGLPAVLVGRLCAVVQGRPAVRALYAFGSRLDGEANPDADLDLGVLYTAPQRLEATLRLEEVLDRASPHRVDLIDVSRARAYLALAVVRGERLYTRDPLETDLFELYVLRRAGDLLPFERQRRALLLSPRR